MGWVDRARVDLLLLLLLLLLLCEEWNWRKGTQMFSVIVILLADIL